MAERIYRHGGKFEPAELIERVIGGPLDPEPLLGLPAAKYGELYGLGGPNEEGGADPAPPLERADDRREG